MVYDLIIVGMGPAGVSSAIYAKRAGLSVLCLDKAMIGGYLNYIDRIDNYPGLYGISGPDFAFKLYEHIKKLNIEFKNENVVSIVDGNIKEIVTNVGRYFCKNVIIATGRMFRKLGIKGEEELLGRGISHCALCDGMFYKNKKVAVVGGGDSALQEAIYLSNIADEVYLIHRSGEFRAFSSLIDKINEKNNIVKLMNTNIVDLKSDEGKLVGIELDTGKIVDVDGLFVYIGFVPATEFAKKLGITNTDGYIVVNDKYETKLKGIYAVGDIILKDVYQISTAVADGVYASINIIENCK